MSTPPLYFLEQLWANSAGRVPLVALPDVGATQPVSFDENDRLLRVSAEHNSLEFKSLKQVTDNAVDLMGRQKQGFKLMARKPFKLDNRRAMKIRAEYDDSKGRMVEEEVIVLRARMIYEVGLTTTPHDYTADEQRFGQIVGGFRFWRIHYCAGLQH